ncbi:MAG: TIGR00153 family protein [Candidatus Aureabacteria bacterium]|nr:TIGR00153 family protein [Candidatus Auribacterota bacterium]
MFWDKKEQQVKDFMKEHLGKIKECLQVFEKTINIYLDGKEEEANTSSYNVHKEEHAADEIRRKILAKLSEGAFLPFFREDYIGIVELVDKIANRAKTVTQNLVIECPKIPEEMHDDIRLLAHKAVVTIEPLIALFEVPLLDKEKSMVLIQEISTREQAADAIEFKLLKHLFKESKISLAEKIIIGTTIKMISEVADAIENVGDRVQILISKQAI